MGCIYARRLGLIGTIILGREQIIALAFNLVK
jgi:hypothetical protein